MTKRAHKSVKRVPKNDRQRPNRRRSAMNFLFKLCLGVQLQENEQRTQTAYLGTRALPRLPPTLRNHQQGIQNSAETRLDIADSLNEIRLGPPPPPPPPSHVPPPNVLYRPDFPDEAEMSEPNSNVEPTENSATQTNEDISPDKQSAHKSSRCIIL